MAHVGEPIPPIRSIRSDIPEAVVAVLERMVAKEPDQRFQTAAEVVEALGPLANDSDLKRLGQTIALPSEATLRQPSPFASGEIRHRPDGKYWWRPAVMSVAAVLVLVALGTAGRAFMNREHGTRPPQPESAAIAGESGGGAEKVSGKPRLAVLYFENNSSDGRSLAALEKGLCAMMIADLTALGEYQVVERERIEAVLKELQLSHGSGFDQTTAARVGKLLGAQQLVLGSYFELLQNFRVDARIVDVETGVTLAASGVEGTPSHLGGLLHELSTDLVKKQRRTSPKEMPPGVPAKTDTRSSVAPPMAVVARFGEALDAYDRGDSTASRRIVQEFLARDDTFDPARRLLGTLDGKKSNP